MAAGVRCVVCEVWWVEVGADAWVCGVKCEVGGDLSRCVVGGDGSRWVV